MEILKLRPACQDYIWGGDILKKEYGIVSDKDPVAEAWVLSCHPDGLSTVDNGDNKGKTFAEYIKKAEKEILGENAASFKDFPVLVKLIDAAKDLSIQVHPDDEYAAEHEGQNGKTELWYILDSAPDAYIYYGFKKSIKKEEFKNRIDDNSILEILNKIEVKKGDVFFIEPGTVHAIGKGTVLAEIQQNSNVTYRVYDYARVGTDGKPRPLHIDKALDVARLTPPAEHKITNDILASCKYFSTRRIMIDSTYTLQCDGRSFKHALIISGHGSIITGHDSIAFKKGDSFFIPADQTDLIFNGKSEVLITEIP